MDELKELLTAITKKRGDFTMSLNIFNDGSGRLIDGQDYEIFDFQTTEEMFEKLKKDAK